MNVLQSSQHYRLDFRINFLIFSHTYSMLILHVIAQCPFQISYIALSNADLKAAIHLICSSTFTWLVGKNTIHMHQPPLWTIFHLFQSVRKLRAIVIIIQCIANCLLTYWIPFVTIYLHHGNVNIVVIISTYLGHNVLHRRFIAPIHVHSLDVNFYM